MVTFDVCWIEGIADTRRVAGVQMAELPRRGDWIDLEHLPDEMFKKAFKGEEPHDVCNLAVEKVIHRAFGAGSVKSAIEVWVTAPGVQVCPHCGREV